MRWIAGALCASCIVTTPAMAQSWLAEAHAGRLRYDVGAGLIESASMGLGIRYADMRSWLHFSVGLPLAEDQGGWAGAGTWQRLAVRLGDFTLGADLTGHAFGSRQRVAAGGLLDPLAERTVTSFALSGEALPLVGYSRGPLSIEGRAGAARYHRRAGDDRISRSVSIADATVEIEPASDLAFRASFRRFDAAEASYSQAVVGAAVIVGSAQLWGSVGHWFDAEVAGIPWSAAVSWGIGPRFALNAQGRRDTVDPLYGAPPRTTWSVGVSYALAGPRALAEPVPASYSGGMATIELPLGEGGDGPAIAGDFNEWAPHPMQRSGDRWTYSVKVEPGVYHYAFVDSDGTWFVPESVAGRKEDGMGGHVAILVVQ